MHQNVIDKDYIPLKNEISREKTNFGESGPIKIEKIRKAQLTNIKERFRVSKNTHFIGRNLLLYAVASGKYVLNK